MDHTVAQTFDVFVSYKSEYLPWVEGFARNLQRQGLSVWLDDWHRVPGTRVSQTLQAALDSSSAAVLVVTPEAAQSGWVQSEYERMRQRQRSGGGFRCVPVILQAADGFAFLDELFVVDFQQATTPDLYRRRLYEVVCGLRGVPSRQGHALIGDIELPPQMDKAPLTETDGIFGALLEDVKNHRIAAVFLQEGADRLLPVDMLLDAARRRFPHATLHHVIPPSCDENRFAEYFSWIGKLCGLDGTISDAFSFGSAFASRLHDGAEYVLVVSHMENGPAGARRAFAAQLRQVLEQFRDRLCLVFLGGEKLDELVFHGSHDISLLNNALNSTHDWPAPRSADLQVSTEQAGLSDAEADALIEVTGGEARLVAECLRRRLNARDRSTASFQIMVEESTVVRQWFAPFFGDQVASQQLCRLLDQDDLGVFGRIRTNSLLRRLYWRGALRKIIDEHGVDRLRWRCDAAKSTGRKILQCDLC